MLAISKESHTKVAGCGLRSAVVCGRLRSAVVCGRSAVVLFFVLLRVVWTKTAVVPATKTGGGKKMADGCTRLMAHFFSGGGITNTGVPYSSCWYSSCWKKVTVGTFFVRLKHFNLFFLVINFLGYGNSKILSTCYCGRHAWIKRKERGREEMTI